MDQILIALKGTPWWVYVLFFYVLRIGLIARKSRVLSLKKMFILPGIIFVLSIYNIIAYFESAADIVYYVLFLVGGCIAGNWMTKSRPIRADRKKFLVKVPGSNSVLILVLIFFAIKYFFGYYYATQTEIPDTITFVRLAIFGAITGIFIGRVYCFLMKFSKAHHEKLKIKK